MGGVTIGRAGSSGPPANQNGHGTGARSRVVISPRGPNRTCATWAAEAALRMLMNNLDPDVAERPEDLVVYGGRGQAARNWESFDAIVAAYRALSSEIGIDAVCAIPVSGLRGDNVVEPSTAMPWYGGPKALKPMI